MIPSYITWTVNPILFEIGPVSVRWYGLCFAIAFLLGHFLVKKIFEKEKISIDWLDKLLIYTMIGTIVGARLGHVLFYDFKDYLANPLDILKVWQGGLASHGAIIGIAIALTIYSKKVSKKSLLWILDRIVMTIAIGGALVRFGNLMNHEIIGVPTQMPWAFVFTLVDTLPRHPTQIYESLLYVATFLVLYKGYWSWNWQEQRGKLTGAFFMMMFSARIFVEFLKENQVDFEQSMRLNMGQILSIPVVLVGIYLWVNSNRSETSKAKSK